MVKTTLRTYYFLSALSRLAAGFAFATYVLFLLDKGLDLFQVNLVNFVFMATIFLLEIPTGTFADTLGRKNSVALGFVFHGLCGLVYFLSSSFWGFILAEILGAIGICFVSGAFDAWVVDSLKHKGYEGEYETVFSKSSIYSEAAVIVGVVSGGYLGTISLALPWLASAVMFFLLFAFARLLMTETYFKRKPLKLRSTFGEMRKTAESSIRYGAKHPVVFKIIIAGFLLGVATQPWNMFWAPFFQRT